MPVRPIDFLGLTKAYLATIIFIALIMGNGF